MKNKKWALVTTVIVFLAGGCLHDTPPPIKSRADAGAVLMAVDSATPWHGIKDDFHPNFKMDSGNQALDKVIPRTAKIQEQILDAMGFSLGLGLPQSFDEVIKKRTQADTSQTDTATGTTTGSSATETSEASTQTEKQGEVPDVSGDIPAHGSLPEAKAPDLDPGMDPFLQYQAALSLFQSVKLLNRAVNDLAIREGYVPYVARMRLGFMPYRRHVPYDIHAQISFFWANTKKNTTGTDVTGLRQKGDSYILLNNKNDTDQDEDGSEITVPSRLPYIMPILVTDNLERAITSKASAVARQIGLALNFMVNGVGGQAGFNKNFQKVSAVLADDMNSLMTISRLTDNTLYARIGAANQATERYGLVGRNYEVALLLLVPKSYFNPEQATKLSIIAHTQMRDAEKGVVLAQRDEASIIEKIDHGFNTILRAKYPNLLNVWENKKDKEKLNLAAKLAGRIQTGEYIKFVESVNCELSALKNQNAAGEKEENKYSSNGDLSIGYIRALWVDLAGLAADSSHHSASVELPIIKAPVVPEQTGLLVDDSKTASHIVLRNVSGVTQSNLQAQLDLSVGGTVHTFPATKTSINKAMGTVTYSFPSFKAMKLGKIDFKSADTKVVLKPKPPSFSADSNAACQKGGADKSISILPLPVKKSPRPNLTIRTELAELQPKIDHKDKAVIHLERFADHKAIISVKGARLDKASEEGKIDLEIKHARTAVLHKMQAAVSAGGKKAVLPHGKLKPETRTIHLELGSLKPGRDVVVTVKGVNLVKEGAKESTTGELSLEFSVNKGS